MEFEIFGVDATTGKERVSIVSADSEREALAMAKAQGILTTDIKRFVSPPPSPPPPVRKAVHIPQDENLASVFGRYLNYGIGINYRDADKYESARLVRVTNGHFSVFDISSQLLYHFPMQMVISVVESAVEDGTVSAGSRRNNYPLVVQVFHMVIYKGAVGVSWGL